MPWHPPAPPRRRDPRGPWTDPGDHPHTPLWGNTRTPPPPPGARGAGRSTHLPANTGGHRRYGGPPGAAAPYTARRPPGAQGPGPRPRLGAMARAMTPQPAPHPLPSSPPQSTTRHCPRHGTDAPGGSGKGTPAATHAYQGNSDGRLRWVPPAGRPPPPPVPLPLPRLLPGVDGGDPRGARGAEAGGGGGAGRAAAAGPGA